MSLLAETKHACQTSHENIIIVIVIIILLLVYKTHVVG